jgi:hypothetical protein
MVMHSPFDLKYRFTMTFQPNKENHSYKQEAIIKEMHQTQSSDPFGLNGSGVIFSATNVNNPLLNNSIIWTLLVGQTAPSHKWALLLGSYELLQLFQVMKLSIPPRIKRHRASPAISTQSPLVTNESNYTHDLIQVLQQQPATK